MLTPKDDVLGVVRFYNQEKCFGFIEPNSGDSGDCFFSQSALPRGLVVNDGDVVSFTMIENIRKPGRFAATNIRLVRRYNGTPG